MTKEDFDAAIETAKRLEKKILEYSVFEGDINLDKTMDVEPAEYVDLTYRDLVNEYERGQKILSTRKMEIYAEREKEAKVSVESAEVETKLREMTTETLEEAKEVAKEPAVELEKPAPEIELERGEKPTPEIELEREEKPTPEIELEKEEKPAPEIELERIEEKPTPEIELEKVEEAPKEVPKEVARPPEAPEKKPPPKVVPPALRETPDEAAEKRYTKMEEQVQSMLGEKADEFTMKKKMLELTKQLFKEKSANRRADIKVQITVLKNMLVRIKKGKTVGRVKKEETYSNIYQTMLSTQQAEVAQMKDKVVDSYEKQMNDIKNKFYEDLSATEEQKKRKEIYEKFVFDVTQLIEQLPAAVKEQEEFSRKKHLAELERLKGSMKEKDKKTLAKVEKRIEDIEEHYGREFGTIKKVVGGQIESLIEVTGADIFKKPEEKPKKGEIKVHEVVKEINETDEGTLLYYLHSNDPDYYRKYERKQVAKAEAIARAKSIMGKERGLKPAMVKKYFSYQED